MPLIVNNLILRYFALNQHDEIINMSKNDQLLLLLCIEIFWLPLICHIYKMCTIEHIFLLSGKRVERPSKFPENNIFCVLLVGIRGPDPSPWTKDKSSNYTKGRLLHRSLLDLNICLYVGYWSYLLSVQSWSQKWTFI